MAKNPFKPIKDFDAMELSKSKGILEDFDVKKNIATREGTVEKVPVNANDMVNKFYVDNAISDLLNGENEWFGTNSFPADSVSNFNFYSPNLEDTLTINFLAEAASGRILYAGATNTFSTSNSNFTVNGDFTVTGESYQNHAASQPSRALSTIYQNTTGHPIIVYGSISITYNDNSAADIGWFEIRTDSASTPTTVVERGGVYNSFNAVLPNSAYQQYIPFFFVVQNNHYYRIVPTVAGAGACTIDKWNEVNF